MVNPAMVKRSAASVAGLAETPISRQCHYADFRQNYDSRDSWNPTGCSWRRNPTAPGDTPLVVELMRIHPIMIKSSKPKAMNFSENKLGGSTASLKKVRKIALRLRH